MKYLISTIFLFLLISCSSSLKKSNTLLNNSLKDNVSHLYETTYECPLFKLQEGEEEVNSCLISDSIVRIFDRNGLRISNEMFLFHTQTPWLYYENEFLYDDNILKSVIGFNHTDSSTTISQVVKYQKQQLPSLVEMFKGDEMIRKEEIHYNKKGLVVQDIELDIDGIAKRWITTNHYNDKNNLEKSVYTDFLFEEATSDTTHFKYLEYDLKGNWTKREERSNDSHSITYRKYEYYK